MKYFVTGATGFIGGRLVQQLVEAGHEVTALVRDPARASALAQSGVRLVQGDVVDRDSMRAGMRGVDGLFHLAAWFKVGVRDKTPAHPVNVEGTRNVLELMREFGVARGVYTSTLAVNSDTGGNLVDETYRHSGPWLSVYEKTKWQAHYEVAVPMIEAGLPLVIVMPGFVYGPGDQGPTHDFMVDFLKERLPLSAKGTAFCWGHVEDVARAHRLAMEKGRPGESYIIGGPVHGMQEVIDMLVEYTPRATPRWRPGPLTMKAMAGVMRVVGSLIPLPPMYTAEMLRSIAGVTFIGDNSKARKELGLVLRPLREGLRETIDYEMRRLGMRNCS